MLTLSGDRVCAMTRFDNSVLPSFGLPGSRPMNASGDIPMAKRMIVAMAQFT